MTRTYYTKRQIIGLLTSWGHSSLNVPTNRTVEVTLPIPPACTPTHTHVRLSMGPLTERKQRLYGLEFVNV